MTEQDSILSAGSEFRSIDVSCQVAVVLASADAVSGDKNYSISFGRYPVSRLTLTGLRRDTFFGVFQIGERSRIDLCFYVYLGFSIVQQCRLHITYMNILTLLL